MRTFLTNPFYVRLILWLALTLSIVLPFIIAATEDVQQLKSEDTALSRARLALLPGRTTHGHYQIELACNACHTENMGVKANACNDCHGEQLKQSRDTHPASKFTDPSNAFRLEHINVLECSSCHREHVPDQTLAMGLSLPKDYCYHCHQDVMEHRPSHKNYAFDSCSNAGCHNYHDNRALFEKFLYQNRDQPNVLPNPVIPLLSRENYDQLQTLVALIDTDQDAPPPHQLTLGAPMLSAWAESAHAQAGINCSHCHVANLANQNSTTLVPDTSEPQETWHDTVAVASCATCHQQQTDGWLQGRHGMRQAVGLPPMQPRHARLPMKPSVGHQSLDCSSCHNGHRFDTQFAAMEACLQCHDDEHSKAYTNTSHYELWQQEMAGEITTGRGVSCATCHMPRCTVDGQTFVQHNQNDNLRPNEKMVRTVCANCHGLEFSLSALADSNLTKRCFDRPPSQVIESVQMATRWFEEKARKRAARQPKEPSQ